MLETSAKLLSAEEAAERLSISPQQVRLLIRQGKLPAEKFGRDWVIKAGDVRQLKERPKTGRPRGAKDTKPRKVSTPKTDVVEKPPAPPPHPPFPTKHKAKAPAEMKADDVVRTQAEIYKRADKRVKQ
jgi:excisionase family DNA binding protein